VKLMVKEVNAHQSETVEYIRRNISPERVRKVEDLLSKWNMLNLREYFERWLMESVYRGHRRSYKIDYSKWRGLWFLRCILYILFGEPELTESWQSSEKLKEEMKKVLEKHFPKGSHFLEYSLKYLEAKTGEKDERTGWINVKPYMYPTIGGEIFFYCTLKALIEICEKAIKNRDYSFPQFVTPKEGIVNCLISEILDNNI
jgi:hypothetical protein